MRDLSPPELKAHLDETEQQPLLLDVREPWELETARLPNAQNIPMGQIPGMIDELDPDRDTVVICHHGIRSMQVALFLEQNGFTDMINLRGGIDAWAREVDPSVPTY